MTIPTTRPLGREAGEPPPSPDGCFRILTNCEDVQAGQCPNLTSILAELGAQDARWLGETSGADYLHIDHFFEVTEPGGGIGMDIGRLWICMRDDMGSVAFELNERLLYYGADDGPGTALPIPLRIGQGDLRTHPVDYMQNDVDCDSCSPSVGGTFEPVTYIEWMTQSLDDGIPYPKFVTQISAFDSNATLVADGVGRVYRAAPVDDDREMQAVATTRNLVNNDVILVQYQILIPPTQGYVLPGDEWYDIGNQHQISFPNPLEVFEVTRQSDPAKWAATTDPNLTPF
jgi:hypothetical protein